MLVAEIRVCLKEGVLDPQGETVKRALSAMGYDGVAEVRIGKLIQVSIDGSDAREVLEQIDDMCKKLLANPVLEDYTITLVSN